MTEQHIRLAQVLIQAVLALVLLVGMIWIILNPNTSDAASKGALVVVSSAAGFLFGRNTPE